MLIINAKLDKVAAFDGYNTTPPVWFGFKYFREKYNCVEGDDEDVIISYYKEDPGDKEDWT